MLLLRLILVKGVDSMHTRRGFSGHMSAWSGDFLPKEARQVIFPDPPFPLLLPIPSLTLLWRLQRKGRLGEVCLPIFFLQNEWNTTEHNSDSSLIAFNYKVHLQPTIKLSCLYYEISAQLSLLLVATVVSSGC